MKKKRNNPPKFRDLTKEEKAVICNGCGSKGGWISVPDFCFEASCDHHDFNYFLGHEESDRLKSDYAFYIAMKRDASQTSFWIRWWNYSMAWTYHRAVRIFGSKSFHYTESLRTWKDIEEKVNEVNQN